MLTSGKKLSKPLYSCPAPVVFPENENKFAPVSRNDYWVIDGVKNQENSYKIAARPDKFSFKSYIIGW